jgi:hypothetical protein
MKIEINHLLYLAILLFVIEGCTNSVHKNSPNTLQAQDSYKYKQLKGKFYTNEYGRLFEQKSYAIAGKGETFDAQLYFDSVVSINVGDSTIEKSLSEVVDIPTFKDYKGSLFSKDKNNIYYSYASTGGTNRFVVNGANPNTFKTLSDYQYGIDDSHIFYQSKIIKGLNFKKHTIIYSLDTSDMFVKYIKDDKVVFYNGDTVKGADAKTFKLVKEKKWEAEDKNYKYECCGQRLN